MSTFVKTTDSFVQGARTMPGEYYTSPDILAREMVRLFQTRWLCVGRADQLAEPGAFFVQEVGADSLILLRDRAGTIRALHNVCRHRGTRLCEEHSGRFSETIQCPYHAWTYATDGRLLGAPHMHEAEGFDKKDYPLHQAHVATWHGFLFLNLSTDPEPIEEALAPLAGRFDRYNLGQLVRVRRIDYEVRANWKLIFQNYSECLHCPTIHPELSRLLPYTSGANDLVEGPFLGGHMEITQPNQSVTITGAACGVPLGSLPPDDLRRAYYYTIFPNMMLSIHPDYVAYYRVWPLAADRSAVFCEWLSHPDTLKHPELSPDGAVEFWDLTNRQDWHVSELSQAGISSSVYRPGPYSPRESIPAAWDRAYLEAIR